MLLTYLQQIKDGRRKQGKMFDLPHIVLFSIFAITSGADSYRKIEAYIQENFNTLNTTFNTKWKRSPCYNSIRHCIQNIDYKNMEEVFRHYSRDMQKELSKRDGGLQVIALDGKTLRHSFENIEDQNFKQILGAFSGIDKIILAHRKIGTDKEHEIDAVISLIKELDIHTVIYTLDALHNQKKR